MKKLTDPVIEWKAGARAHYARLVLPIPPSFNEYWTPTTLGKKKARMVLARGKKRKDGTRAIGGKEYRELVADYVSRLSWHGLLPMLEPVRCVAALFFQTAAGDPDNRSKGLLDALEFAGVLSNDRYVYEHNIFRQGRAPKPGLVVVELESFEHVDLTVDQYLSALHGNTEERSHQP